MSRSGTFSYSNGPIEWESKTGTVKRTKKTSRRLDWDEAASAVVRRRMRRRTRLVDGEKDDEEENCYPTKLLRNRSILGFLGPLWPTHGPIYGLKMWISANFIVFSLENHWNIGFFLLIFFSLMNYQTKKCFYIVLFVCCGFYWKIIITYESSPVREPCFQCPKWKVVKGKVKEGKRIGVEVI